MIMTDRPHDMVVTYGGEEWAALRENQQRYVQHLMLSWRAHGPMMIYDRRVLRRAIRKAKENMP